MSVVSRSDRACARSTSSGIDAMTPPTLSASGRCNPASSPKASARCSSCRLLASSLTSGSSSGRFRDANVFSPLPLLPRGATFRFLETERRALPAYSRPSYMRLALRLISIPLLAIVLVACQIGPDLKCSVGDHAFEDAQAGWGFCYPGTWKYNERANQSASPSGLDLT